MANWLVWGDYVHTRPDVIGTLRLRDCHARYLEQAAARGFDVEDRLKNGFQPWAATFTGAEAGDPDDERFALAAYPTVRGWAAIE